MQIFSSDVCDLANMFNLFLAVEPIVESCVLDKYQAIAERSVNGTIVKGPSSSNPLAKLVGGYASESDDDDDDFPNKKNSLDAKVEEFMKVRHTMNE